MPRRNSSAALVLAALVAAPMVPLTANAAFIGDYAPGNWTDGGSFNNAPPAGVDTSGAPASVAITNSSTLNSADPLFGLSGVFSWSIVIAGGAGQTLSFDWDWLSSDVNVIGGPIGNRYDAFAYIYDGVETILTVPEQDCWPDDPTCDNASGNVSISVDGGKVFGFLAKTLDNGGGTATTTITNFDVSGSGPPQPTPAPAPLALMGLGLSLLALRRR